MPPTSEVKIAGKVLYNDATPASGAIVRIWDEDGFGGTDDDLILTKTTGPNGEFSGAGPWKDTEGFGAPDFLRLRFRVDVDGKKHEGPFIRIDANSSAPIVLPFPPRKPVKKSARELVQVIYVATDYDSDERELYEFIETATEGLTSQILGGSYNRITFVKGANATLGNIRDALIAAAKRPGIEAVDLIFTTHGHSKEVVLAEAKVPTTILRAALNLMPDDAQAKLRICFSTACFGAKHLNAWMAAGFADASGSRGTYADSAVSYAPFLAAWAAERTFGEAVAIANAADIGDAADNIARAYYVATNRPDNADDVDSTRVLGGNGSTRIYSKP